MTSISLAGYRISEQIHASHRTLIYRGERERDRCPVTIKVLSDRFPHISSILQLRNHYIVTRDLDLPNIPKTLALETYQNAYALVTEDVVGISLKDLLATEGALGTNPQKSILFLQIAIQLAQTLAGLYDRRVIHKDIKPANILFDLATQQLNLIDFSISSLLPRETQSIQNITALEGTLAYIAPEQTGRMNRGIDYRSDFYALGVTCYELLTGQLPFISTDPIELVHFHLAKQPEPAHHVQSNIPVILSQIVSKLMAKNAENRYQNALGLKYDLENCLTQLQTTGKIVPFALGTKDLTDRFTIPERLYGREFEVSALLAAFDRVSQGGERPAKGRAELMLVAGYSGIGKTAIVQEIHKPIVRQRGYFIKGKFDQFQRNVPFSAFFQAFGNLLGQLGGESDSQRAVWKHKILTAVGEQGQVLIDVIPELESLLGLQFPAPELSASAAQQRFNLLMQKFVGVFTTGEHPLVIFLDDLQWADLASLNLLQLLMQDAAHLLVLGAYRDNEVSSIHPLKLTIDEILTNGATVNTITIKPLGFSDLNQLVADTLNCDLRLAEPLAKLVEQKTQGNPFFVTQFLKSLYQDGLITFYPITHQQQIGGWQCDLAKVRNLAVTDDIVEFMALQLQRLPQETQEALKLAACIGAQFDLNTLAIVSQISAHDLAKSLWESLAEGLLIPINETYKFFTQSDDGSGIAGSANPVYRFLHDRVQQSAYSLIPDRQKPETHLKIGKLIEQDCSEITREEKLFDLVGHLNIAKELITDPVERASLAQLNLSAGKKARNSTAYAAANIYLQTGIELLQADCWETQYQLTLDLHVAATEATYLNGDLDGMEEIASVVMRSAKTILDKVEVYRIQIAALTTNGMMLESIDLGIKVLEQLGVKLSTISDEAEIGKVLQALEIQLQDRQIEDLLDLPVMRNLQIQSTMKLLEDLGAPIFMAMPSLLPILSSKMVSLSVEFGNTLASAGGYINHGLVLSAFLGNVDMGYRFGNLSLNLTDRLNSLEFKGRSLFLFATWIQHRRDFIRTILPTFKYVYTVFRENGDFINTGYSISCYFDANLLCGVELNYWEPEISPYSKDLERAKQYSARAYLQMKQQLAQNLMTSGSQQDCLIGSAYDETVMIAKHQQDGDRTALAYAYIYKLMLAYLFGNYTAALANISQAEQYLLALSGMIPIPVFHFYAALTYLALDEAGESSDRDPASTLARTNTLALVEAHQATIELWAQTAPMNYQHKWHTIEAEKQRVLGNKGKAIAHYELAIAGAKEHQFIHEEALANELTGKFYLDWGNAKVAKIYLVEAYYCYTRWGAIAKANHLIALYPQLLGSIINPDNTNVFDAETNDLGDTFFGSSESLDLAAILEASKSISQEIDLDRSICNLLNIVITNAGADKCLLLLQAEDELQIIAKVELGQQPQVLAPMPLSASEDLVISLVNRAKHDLKPSILVNATQDTDLSGDLYLQQHQPHSILCLPILHQCQLVGILYLENHVTTAAFTDDRIDILQLLTAQAAISIENAKLHSNLKASHASLEQKVAERTIELQVATARAEQANQAKTSFLNFMTHELRTPLNAIVGMSEALQSQSVGEINQKQRQYLQTIDRGSTHLLELIDDILDTAKIEAGMLELHCTPIDIDALCNASTMMVEQQATKKQIDLDLKISPQLPTLVADERRIRQVLINLLNNAVKFTHPGGHITLEVTLLSPEQTGAKTSAIRFAVSDNGIGISSENLAKLFKPFVQIDNALSRKAKGTGLGLNLVKQIVELHGGKVTATSAIDVGSCFAIDLPCSDLPFVFALYPHSATEAGSATSDLMMKTKTAPTILFIDDNAANIQTTSSYLRAKGYKIITATSSREAIVPIGFNLPDVILIELRQSDLDNFSAIEQLRQDPQFSDLPIVAIANLELESDGAELATSNIAASDETENRCLAAGANYYLSKPIGLKSIAQTIQDCLTEARQLVDSHLAPKQSY